jgi:hypothetical protein
MPFDVDAAMRMIEKTVDEFVSEQKQLDHLKRGRVENTFVADLAHKLKPLFESGSISVDSHYNRHIQARKRLFDKNIELDVAIHERGKDENNLVAIEVETTNRPKRDDIWKLEGLTQPLEGYGYKLGLFLVLGVEENAGKFLAREWYANGKKL